MSDIDVLIDETKLSVIEYIPKLMDACDILYDDMQKYLGVYLLPFIDGIEWLINAVNGIKAARPKDLATIDINILTQLIAEIQLALGKRDYIALADVIQYEIKPLLTQYLTDMEKDQEKCFSIT